MELFFEYYLLQVQRALLIIKLNFLGRILVMLAMFLGVLQLQWERMF